MMKLYWLPDGIHGGRHREQDEKAATVPLCRGLVRRRPGSVGKGPAAGRHLRRHRSSERLASAVPPPERLRLYHAVLQAVVEPAAPAAMIAKHSQQVVTPVDYLESCQWPPLHRAGALNVRFFTALQLGGMETLAPAIAALLLIKVAKFRTALTRQRDLVALLVIGAGLLPLLSGLFWGLALAPWKTTCLELRLRDSVKETTSAKRCTGVSQRVRGMMSWSLCRPLLASVTRTMPSGAPGGGAGGVRPR